MWTYLEKFGSQHFEDIIAVSISSIFITSFILAQFRDALKRAGKKVYDVKFMPWKMRDKIDSFGYMIAFWYFGNDSLLYNFILTIWRLGFYGMVFSIIFSINHNTSI